MKLKNITFTSRLQHNFHECLSVVFNRLRNLIISSNCGRPVSIGQFLPTPITQLWGCSPSLFVLGWHQVHCLRSWWENGPHGFAAYDRSDRPIWTRLLVGLVRPILGNAVDTLVHLMCWLVFTIFLVGKKLLICAIMMWRKCVIKLFVSTI